MAKKTEDKEPDMQEKLVPIRLIRGNRYTVSYEGTLYCMERGKAYKVPEGLAKVLEDVSDMLPVRSGPGGTNEAQEFKKFKIGAKATVTVKATVKSEA